MTMGNFRLRVTRRRGDVRVTRLKRLASGAYVVAANVTFKDRDLRKNPLTLVELIDAKILPKESLAIE